MSRCALNESEKDAVSAQSNWQLKSSLCTARKMCFTNTIGLFCRLPTRARSRSRDLLGSFVDCHVTIRQVPFWFS